MREGIRKEYKEIYDASVKKISLVHVPDFNYLMIDGIGNPNVAEFKEKAEALKILSKAIKDYYKNEYDLLYPISPLEGLWDTYNNAQFDVTRKKFIKFTLMMVQPKTLDDMLFDQIKVDVASKKDNPYIMDCYLNPMKEGLCVQVLHKGAYNEEINTTSRLMEYITVHNMRLKGFHHEIYLNDPEKVTQDKLKTIVRYSVGK